MAVSSVVVVGVGACWTIPEGGANSNRGSTGDPTTMRAAGPSRPAAQPPEQRRAGGTLAGVSTDPKDRWLDLGSFIREQRGSARLSLRRLSELAGISNPYLSQIERGPAPALGRDPPADRQGVAHLRRDALRAGRDPRGAGRLARPHPGHPGRPDDQRGAEAGPRAHLPLLPARARGRARGEGRPPTAAPPRTAAASPPAARPGGSPPSEERPSARAGGVFPTAGRL